ncbi:hypothetical protein GCM10011380_05290 [Sphingomonas metalli]|uniref:Phospholipid/glycerol acyltransferase domain-containing protein n=1 Tax=Sphingomonas metalli TaxID=1779358 RepID=A0A916WN96_9SPHN|nr:lysophospholipid acyltransferase family protein [Sphingomonas metalli]GGB18664.1 hypothetical protein GCM10011380_05290 [Sphingomonas metalli]
MPTLRATFRLLALALLLVALAPLDTLWRLARRPSPWPQRFLRAAARLLGARLRIIGTPRRHDVVILANHLSWLDILLLGGACGASFVSREDIGRTPLVGWMARRNHTIFIARGDRMGVEAQIAAIRAALGPHPVAIFPEGTTGSGDPLLPFKPALLAALDPPPPGLVVQAVRIDYGDATRELAWVDAEPGLSHARRVLGRRGSFTATLEFDAPFAPAGGRKAIAAEARRRIEAMAQPPKV